MATVFTASAQSLPSEFCGGPNHEFLVKRGDIVMGDEGAQIYVSSARRVAVFDDFLGDAVDARWNFVEGTDSATSAESILAGGIGGVLRMTTGDAGTGLAADLIQLNSARQWQASNGDLVLEAKVKISQITEAYVFVGFTDVLTLEAPVVSAASADTITTNATDGVGFMFDTRMATDNWWLVGVANDVDATAQDSASAPAADTYQTLRVEVTSAGVASFYIDGSQVGTAMTGAVTAATDLTPTIAVSKTATNTSMTLDCDYLHVAMAR
jgi:hypothetical protein